MYLLDGKSFIRSSLKKTFIYIIFLLDASFAYAQSVEPFPVYPHFELREFASLFSVEQSPEFSQISLSYFGITGDFNRPQLPDSGHLGNFNASGKQQKDNLIWSGSFSWQYQRDEGQQWNNTSLHPDVQPYLWADAGKGRWDRNHFNAQVQVGTTNLSHLNWGGGLFFEGGEADRFNDPKPLYRFRRFGISPEGSMHFSKDNWIALKLLYSSYSEDNEIGFFSIDDPLLYRLRGYGTFTRTPFVSGERQLRSQSVGGTIRWLIPNNRAAQFGGSTTWGNAKEGISIVTDGGEWKTLEADFGLEKSWQNVLHKKNVNLTGRIRENEGTDAIFQAINARLRTAQVAIQWTMATLDSTAAFHWQIQAEAAFTLRLQKDLATFTEAKVNSLPFGINLGVILDKSSVSPFVMISTYYYQVLYSDLQVGRESAFSELIIPDFEFLGASAYTAKLVGGVNWKQSQGTYRLSGFFQRRQAVSPIPSLFQNQFGLTLTFSPKGRISLTQLFNESTLKRFQSSTL